MRVANNNDKECTVILQQENFYRNFQFAIGKNSKKILNYFLIINANHGLK
jgi:hypothetical protein